MAHIHDRDRRQSVRGPARLLEALEPRALLAVGVVFSDTNRDTDADTLRITGDNGEQVVIVEDDTAANVMRLWLDTNGDNDFTDPGEMDGVVRSAMKKITLDLRGGNDTFIFRRFIADPGDTGVNFSERVLDVKLGAGNDQCEIDVAWGENDLSSYTKAIKAKVKGEAGDDTVRAAFNFSPLAQEFRLEADLGSGNNELEARFNADPGGLPGRFVAAVEVRGGSGVDIVEVGPLIDAPATQPQVWWNLAAHPAQSLAFAAFLGGGDDVLRLDGRGESQADPRVYGVWALAIRGDAGDDLIDVAAPAVFTAGDASPSGEWGSGFGLAAVGGSGDDTLLVTLPAEQIVGAGPGQGANTRAPTFSVSLKGEGGDDALSVQRSAGGSIVDPALDGEVVLSLRGGGGDDDLGVDLGALSTITDDSGPASTRLQIEMLGEGGSDRLTLTGDLQPWFSTTPYSVAGGTTIKVIGGGGNDFFNVQLLAPAKADLPTFYRTAYSILLNGEGGRDELMDGAVLPGGALVQSVEVT